MNELVHKTRYANHTTEEVLREANQRELDLNELGRELLYRLEFLYDHPLDAIGR